MQEGILGMTKAWLGRLRFIALLEGVLYGILLAVAMPLKYFYGIPIAVRFFGILHGLFFIVLVFTLLQAHVAYGWRLKFSAQVFVASLIPLGAFWMDRRLKTLEA